MLFETFGGPSSFPGANEENDEHDCEDDGRGEGDHVPGRDH
jgi:hypothetical protein